MLRRRERLQSKSTPLYIITRSGLQTTASVGTHSTAPQHVEAALESTVTESQSTFRFGKARRKAPNPERQELAVPATRENSVRGKPGEEGKKGGGDTQSGSEALQASTRVLPMQCHGELLAEHHSVGSV